MEIWKLDTTVLKLKLARHALGILEMGLLVGYLLSFNSTVAGPIEKEGDKNIRDTRGPVHG